MIADADIPGTTVRAFAGHMARSYGAAIAPKASSSTMRAAGTALRMLGIPLGDRWLTQVVTTMGSTIYVPFEVGEPSADWSPWEQIAVIAHECQHVFQHTRDGVVIPGARYLVDTSQRTATEAEAYVTSAELHWWRYGTLEGWWLEHRATAMHSYGVSAADVTHMRAHLLGVAPIIRRGGLVSHAGRTAIGWLDQHAAELRHPSVASRSPS